MECFLYLRLERRLVAKSGGRELFSLREEGAVPLYPLVAIRPK